MSAPLLICLDLQRAHLTSGSHWAPNGAGALVECGRLLAQARRQQWTIAHCYFRGRGALTVGAEEMLPIHGFSPRSGETVLDRNTLSAYGHPAFASMLERAPHQSALIAGLNASVTFMATAFDAFERGHCFLVAAEALAAQPGAEANANQHEAVARDVAQRLGFPPVFARSPDRELLGALNRPQGLLEP